MIRKNIYRWHRISSLIIAVPVLLWAISGLMHPVMTTIKPRVATQVLNPQALDSSVIQTPLSDALEENNINRFHNVRLIHIDTNWFYQVQLVNGQPPVYLSAKNGKGLRNGDKLYAQYIAKQFLQGQVAVSNSADNNRPELSPASEQEAASASHDCCDAATSCVLLDTTGSLVESVELITAFNKEYKYVNRLLPVYKVKFDRADSIRVYVETTQDRFAFAMDNKRAAFDSFFAAFHTWDWLNSTGIFKHLLMGFITSLAFLTTIMGLYIFFVTKSKRSLQPLAKARRRHRIVSVIASIFTLMFSFSGALHALDKLESPPPVADNLSNDIEKSKADINYNKLRNVLGNDPVYDISAAKFDSVIFWRVVTKAKKVVYINSENYSILPNGEEKHAIALASIFSGHAAREIIQMEKITKFAGEYGFINKRLPVWKISYTSNFNGRYYVETSSGKCAAFFNDKDLIEGYSFAILHKHHFMDWAGKLSRDISTMIAACLQILMVLVGLYLFYKWLKR